MSSKNTWLVSLIKSLSRPNGPIFILFKAGYYTKERKEVKKTVFRPKDVLTACSNASQA